MRTRLIRSRIRGRPYRIRVPHDGRRPDPFEMRFPMPSRRADQSRTACPNRRASARPLHQRCPFVGLPYARSRRLTKLHPVPIGGASADRATHEYPICRAFGRPIEKRCPYGDRRPTLPGAGCIVLIVKPLPTEGDGHGLEALDDLHLVTPSITPAAFVPTKIRRRGYQG